MRLYLNHKNRVWLASGLVVVWLCATAYGFWWFQFKDLRAFSAEGFNRSMFFEGMHIQEKIAQVLSGNKASAPLDDNVSTVVHFWDPACACSRFNEQHVRDLMREYRKRGIRFVVVARDGAFASRDVLKEEATRVFGEVAVVWNRDLKVDQSIPSSPAAIILDNKNQLAYFGPYSQGAVCSVGGGRFVERILDRVLTGDNPRYVNTLAFGCFCDWQRKV